MTLQVANNAFGELNADITDTGTTIVLKSGNGARFPSLAGSQYFYATLIDTNNNLEIVKATARSSDTLTVVRAQDGTSGRAFVANDRIELRPVAAFFDTYQQKEASVDMNGTELILDADGDSSIHASTDDQIDIKVGGNDTAIVTADTVKIRSDNASLVFRRTTSEADIAKIQYVNGNPSLDIGADGKNVRFTNGGSYAETMRIKSDGKVGIGTTNPGTPLQVVNDTDTDYDISTAATNAVLNLKNNTAGANNCVGMSFSTESNGEWYLTCVQESSSETAFHIGARAYGSRHDRMKINSDGTVLIGNKDSNPTAWGLRVFNVHATHATIEGWNDNSSGKNLNLFRYDDASIFQVSNGGAVWAAGGYTSDKAFKNVIGDCTEGWSKLKDVEPKSYRYKRISNVEQKDGTTKEVFSDDDMDSNIHYGVIAQDLKKVLPDITYGEEGKMSVDYHGLLMVAINTIKELEARIKVLEEA